MAAIVGIILLLVLVLGSDDTENNETLQKTEYYAAATPTQNRPVHLYFADANSQFLMAENRVLKSSEDPGFLARRIIEALIKGPQQGLARTLPTTTAIRAVFVTPEGICFVDFTAAVTENHPGGIQPEWLSIYSIVNSLGDDLHESPFWDRVIMRYPTDRDWPPGEIDLRGPGY